MRRDILAMFTSDKPKQWAKWLPLAEWSYNTSYHTAIKMTPFEAVYGRTPPSIATYIPGSTITGQFEQELLDRDALVHALKLHLSTAQNRMQVQHARHHSERTFEVGDMVYTL